MNISERILAAHAGVDRVRPGQIIKARVDLVMAHDVTGPIVFKQLAQYGINRVFDPDKVVLFQSGHHDCRFHHGPVHRPQATVRDR